MLFFLNEILWDSFSVYKILNFHNNLFASWTSCISYANYPTGLKQGVLWLGELYAFLFLVFWELRLMPWATKIGSLLTTFPNFPNFSCWHLYILLGRLPTHYLNTSFMILISVMTFLHFSLARIFISHLSVKTPQFSNVIVLF